MCSLIHKRVYPEDKKSVTRSWTPVGLHSMHGQNEQTCASRQGGMTLVEVMIAMFVLTVVFGGVLSSMVRAAAFTNSSKILYRQTAIMNEKMEEMRAMQFSDLLAKLAIPAQNVGEVPPPTGGSAVDKVLSGNYTYHWERTHATVDSTIVTITVKVWALGQEAHAKSITTQISKSGLINKPSL